MSEERRGMRRLLGGIGRGIDFVRRFVMNLLFIIVMVALLVLILKSGRPDVPGKCALVLEPAGTIVEQLGNDPLSSLPSLLMGDDNSQVLLKDLVDTIAAAKTDERVKVLVLKLDGLGGAGLTKLQDLRKALLDFKKSNKKIIAIADQYSQNAYYLAAHADEIYLHPMGMAMLEGYGRYRTYYKDGLDRLEVQVHIFRVGEYKSAVEPFLRDDMSPEDKEASLQFLDTLWQSYLNDVSAARKIKKEALLDYVNNFKTRLEAAGGRSGEMAVKAGLVDKLMTRDEFRAHMIKLVGENEEKHTFNQIGQTDFLKAVEEDRFGQEADGKLVGVVVASGEILDGQQAPGKIGGDSTAALIRQARLDENIKALVLRVDSGGGSAFASEVIRKELELTRQAGKPVVASMGSVAASGGYWVTMSSDEVWAYPTTITGSIGIFGMFPTFERPMAKYLGMRVDGVGTTKLAGAMRTDRALDLEVGEIIQLLINQGYDEFISKAATARKKSKAEIDKVARGRVWCGSDAIKIGLVDKLGGFEDAIAAAAKRAKLGTDYKVKYVEKELEFKDKVVRELFSRAAWLMSAGDAPPPPAAHLGALRLIAREMQFLSLFNDPNGMYAYFGPGVE